MKKTAIFLITLGSLSILSACGTKNYTCKCFTSGNEYIIEDVSRAAADTECETYEADPFNGNCAIEN